MKVFIKFFDNSDKTELIINDDCTVGDLWLAYKDTGKDAHRMVCKGKILCTVTDPKNPTSDNWESIANECGVSEGCTIIALGRKAQSAPAPAPAPAPVPAPVPASDYSSAPQHGTEAIMAYFEQTLGFNLHKAILYLKTPTNDEHATYVLNNVTLNNLLRENLEKNAPFARIKELNNDFFELLLKDKLFMSGFAVPFISQYITIKMNTTIQQTGLPAETINMLGLGTGAIGQGANGVPMIALTHEENALVETLMTKHNLNKEEVAIAFKGLDSNKETTDECLTKAKNLSSALGLPVIDCIDALLATELSEEMAGDILFG